MTFRNLTLMVASALTAACGSVSIGIALFGPEHPSPILSQVFSNSQYLFTLGVITIFTILGGGGGNTKLPPSGL
jgi:hypothetical protein